MSATIDPFVGIDFGTSKSVIARYDVGTGRAEVIYNQEGRQETPSIVYFGRSENDIVVGEPAEMMLDAVQIDQTRFSISVKRDLLSASTKILGGNRIYRPVDIAAKILGKLKDDAERLCFQGEPVKRAVITYPASFDQLQQDKIRQAAAQAGFEDVVLLPEPVAAAIACSRSGLRMGKHILIYDFGGGTFDVAVLVSSPSTSSFLPFELALPPRGLKDCGGDDLDRRLYDYCEEIALRELQRRISLTNDFDLKFLHDCRKRKENLSGSDTVTFSNYLISSSGAVAFEHTLQRATFEERIRGDINRTITMTQDVIRDANNRQYKVDTVILIGGSSRVPLVIRSLSNELPVQPQEWQQRDFAVALGAAYHAQDLWGPKSGSGSLEKEKTVDEAHEASQQESLDENDHSQESYYQPHSPPPPPPVSPAEQYRRGLLERWTATRRLTQMQVGELTDLAYKLDVSAENAAAIEYQVMGKTKEHILRGLEGERNAALEQYRQAVVSVWKRKKLAPSAVDYLIGQARTLNLTKEDVVGVERQVMGNTKEEWVIGRASQQPGRQSKVLPIILLIIGLLFCVVGLGLGWPSLLIGIPITILSIVLFLRKPKVKVQAPTPGLKNKHRQRKG